MKLGVISPEGVARCLICPWLFSAPLERRDPKTKKKVPCPPEERERLLNKNLFEHLALTHDRLLLTKEIAAPKGEDLGPKVYLHGRRVSRTKEV